MQIACRRHLQKRKAREVGVAYNGRTQWPGQLWAARAGPGREKERLGPGPGQAGCRKRTAGPGPRPGPGSLKMNAPMVAGVSVSDVSFHVRTHAGTSVLRLTPGRTA